MGNSTCCDSIKNVNNKESEFNNHDSIVQF